MDDLKKEIRSIIKDELSELNDLRAVEASIKFNLDNEDGRHNHKLAVFSSDIALAMWTFDQYLRSIVKYGHNPTMEVFDAESASYINKKVEWTQPMLDAAESIREQLRAILIDYKVDFVLDG